LHTFKVVRESPEAIKKFASAYEYPGANGGGYQGFVRGVRAIKGN